MWFDAKSTTGDQTQINRALKDGHKQIYKNKFVVNDIGGVSCLDASNLILYVAWIDIFATNPTVSGY